VPEEQPRNRYIFARLKLQFCDLPAVFIRKIINLKLYSKMTYVKGGASKGLAFYLLEIV
jgi:hypothetical protein